MILNIFNKRGDFMKIFQLLQQIIFLYHEILNNIKAYDLYKTMKITVLLVVKQNDIPLKNVLI